MKKTVFLFLAFILFVSLPASAVGKSEFRRSSMQTYSKNLQKWENCGISSYSMKIVYLAGNVMPVNYFIDVKDKNLVELIIDDQPAQDLTLGEPFLIENLFDMAKVCLKSNKRKSPMLYMVEYDEKYGYVSSCARIKNPNGKNISAPADLNFRIRVIEFLPKR